MEVERSPSTLAVRNLPQYEKEIKVRYHKIAIQIGHASQEAVPDGASEAIFAIFAIAL